MGQITINTTVSVIDPINPAIFANLKVTCTSSKGGRLSKRDAAVRFKSLEQEYTF